MLKRMFFTLLIWLDTSASIFAAILFDFTVFL